MVSVNENDLFPWIPNIYNLENSNNIQNMCGNLDLSSSCLDHSFFFKIISYRFLLFLLLWIMVIN